MICLMFSLSLVAIGLFEIFSSTGSPIAAAGAFISAALFQIGFYKMISRKAIYRSQLASLEAQYAADTLLLNGGHKLNDEEREVFRERAHDIGILRARCGYIPKPNSISALDYQARIRNGRI